MSRMSLTNLVETLYYMTLADADINSILADETKLTNNASDATY